VSTSPRQERIGGGLMMALGGYVAVQGFAYRVGGLTRMGPGFLPVALGVMLVLVGVVLLLRAGAAPVVVALPETMLAEDGEPAGAEWRAWGLILFSIVAFVTIGRWGGLAPATFAIVFISALADRDNTPRQAATLAAAMTVVAAVVFHWALQIQFPLLQWGSQ